ncbi:hypothetical protein OFO01_04940 [Campylobacter sp. JMF_01 NE2]|uniref:hypothetical protein n=1 Tax=unclassified Campylobacter TaxID=2593542 RepID=UPI0022E9CC3B|nr:MULTISPECIES: hypothetical protein [unclassified Campylobacter]MDA3052798.1 hypothetical protein [Campylobacter sp. JMF_03 NE3]MDA3067129.1 hypothetical protein [Campylobacter sp. JMF_01 NE2]
MSLRASIESEAIYEQKPPKRKFCVIARRETPKQSSKRRKPFLEFAVAVNLLDCFEYFVFLAMIANLAILLI